MLGDSPQSDRALAVRGRDQERLEIVGIAIIIK
jgi:hypothetical protein